MWFHKKEKFPYKEGFYQAAGVFGYVVLFGTMINNGEALFPNINKTFGPIMFLTLFCFSVLACGLIVFYKPYMLFIDKKRREAGELVLSTAKWLGVFVAIIVAVVVMMSR